MRVRGWRIKNAAEKSAALEFTVLWRGLDLAEN